VNHFFRRFRLLSAAVAQPLVVALCLVVMPAPLLAQSSSASSSSTASRTGSGTGLDPRLIDGAIERAVRALSSDAMQPRLEFRDDALYYRGGYSQEITNENGNHALACWSLLTAGTPFQDPKLFRRINWVLASDTTFTYDRGMRAQMLAELPNDRWASWIRRDATWLTNAVTLSADPSKPELGGNFTNRSTGTPQSALGDHANGQYGVLGLWGAQRGGFAVRPDLWQRIDSHWRATQIPAGEGKGGWSVAPVAGKDGNAFTSRISGPMTAGGVATLCLTERFLAKQINAKNIRDFWETNPQLQKGVRWLDSNFIVDDPSEDADWFFYMWTIQRVGHATGLRTFNGVDWYRDVTARMLQKQSSDGTWIGGRQGRMLSTSFALLYLTKAYEPLAVSKIRLRNQDKSLKNDDAWNNRPNDLVNFTDFISDEYESATTWQIIDLSMPAESLVESPILYLSTDKNFNFSDEEVRNLRQYIACGGTLVTNSEGGEAIKGIQNLATKLFPGRKLEPMERDHPIYSVHRPIRAATFQAISNGIRPMMIHTGRDLSEGLGTADPTRNPDSFNALSNIYVYTVGKNTRRRRLENNFAVQRVTSPPRPLAAARVQHSGNFDPEPQALPQLKAVVADRCGIDLQLSTAKPAELSNQRMAFLTTLGDAKLSTEETASIRKWIQAGGTLWVDAAGGGEAAAKNAIELVTAIMPDAPLAPLGSDSPILTGFGLPGGQDARRIKFRFFALQKLGPVYSPRLQAVELDGRPAIIYSGEDYTCGLAGLDHWGIFGYSPASSRTLVANGCAAIAISRPGQ
jgi:hypothetical protein